MKFTIISVGALFASASVAAPVVEKRATVSNPVFMGLAKSFGALGYSTMTSVGNTAISGTGGVGNGGAYPGTSITGFPPGTATGALAGGTVLSQNAILACGLAYDNALAVVTTKALPSSQLGGLTITPGSFSFPSSGVALAGNLTLDAQGDSTKQFIFKITTTFDVAALSNVILKNGAQPCNVYFAVGTSAAISAGASMQGNILAYSAIAASEAASNSGTWCALNGGVTLINNALVAQAGACSGTN